MLKVAAEVRRRIRRGALSILVGLLSTAASFGGNLGAFQQALPAQPAPLAGLMYRRVAALPCPTGLAGALLEPPRA